jgi:acyl-CoA dehydrogenase
MSGQHELLRESVRGMFTRNLLRDARERAEGDGWSTEFWTAQEDLGLPHLLADEARGGFGGDCEDACAVARLVGRYAVSAPIVENILAHGLMDRAAMTVAGATVTLTSTSNMTLTGSRAEGTASAVPWGRFATFLLTPAAGPDGAVSLLLLRVSEAVVRTGRNLAGEPRDDLTFDAAVPCAQSLFEDKMSVPEQLAVLRVSQVAGSLESVLEMVVDYANQRIQFGKPLAKFQAIQQQIAMIAEEVAAAVCAADAVSRTAAPFETAAAKLRTNQAVNMVAPLAHQIFGAIGFTAEHSLHRFTQRLISWRSECGSDRYWAGRLGRMVAARGATALWPDITSRTDTLAATQ